MKPLRITACLFFAVFALYLAFSPGSLEGMGYAPEEIRAAGEIMTSPLAAIRGSSIIHWPRNGPLVTIFHMPFVIIGHLHSGDAASSVDRLAAIEPVLFTSLLVALLFIWIVDSTGSLPWAFALSSTAAFATMLWPYAYIDLETTQSLFVLLAGWMALGRRIPRTWLWTAIFAFVCAVAVSAKSTGAFLIPAIVFLLWRWFVPPGVWTLPRLSAKLIVAAVAVSGIFVANSYYRSLFWDRIGGSRAIIGRLLIHDPFSVGLNLLSLFFSANKGLIIYAPVTVLVLYSLQVAWKRNREVAVFALLVVFGLAGGFSLLTNWVDETWGPRYLHTVIAPLVLCVALDRSREPFKLTRQPGLVITSVVGVYVSFLGAFFYYGNLYAAQVATTQQTMEALQSDRVWNHVLFNDRLMRIWLEARRSGSHPAVWRPAHKWWFGPPPDAPPWKTVDLAPLAVPQSRLVRAVSAKSASAIDRAWMPVCLGSAIVGAVLYAATCLAIFRGEKRSSGDAGPVDSSRD